MEDEMTLNEFDASVKMEFSEFVAVWRERMDAGDNSFPVSMPEGEWWEQFVAFVGKR